MRLFSMALAGGLGVVARYAVTVALQHWLSDGGARSWIGVRLGQNFPLGTLVINVSGVFLLSFLTTLALAGAVSPNWRLILGTGFCGGYTTFSTFELEAEGLLSRNEWTPATSYILGNLLLGYVAVLTGRALASRMLGIPLLGGRL